MTKKSDEKLTVGVDLTDTIAVMKFARDVSDTAPSFTVVSVGSRRARCEVLESEYGALCDFCARAKVGMLTSMDAVLKLEQRRKKK